MSSVLVAGCGIAAIASFSGACFSPSDTVPNWPFDEKSLSKASSSSSGGAGGMGGSTAAAGGGGGSGLDCSAKSPLLAVPRDYFIACVLGDPVNNQAPAGGMNVNCTDGNCHHSGNIAFLNPPGGEYETISGWSSQTTGKAFLVKDPEHKSRLVLYPQTDPQTGGHAGGPKWKPNDSKDSLYPLYQNTLTWLNAEVDAGHFIEDNSVETFAVKPNGFTYVPLSSIAGPDALNDPRLENAAITFFAIEHSGTLLELVDLKVYPAPGTGIIIKDMGFKIVPDGGDPKKDAKFDTSLYGDALTFVAPSKVDFGSGQALITNWTHNANLYLTFKSVTSLLADSHGNVFTPCSSVPTFTDGYNAIPYDKTKVNFAGKNGLQFCGKQCHGGGDYTIDPSKHTPKMDLSPIFKDNDFELGCAITRGFITPGNPTQTRIFNATQPLGATAHAPYSFAGNDGAWGYFKSQMITWVCAEAKTQVCSGACVDTQKDKNNCGGCNKPCMNAGETCQSGKCACPSPQTLCMSLGGCVDLTSDAKNCGADCATAMPCGMNQQCVKGMCK